jgi:hypothetical protein
MSTRMMASIVFGVSSQMSGGASNRIRNTQCDTPASAFEL